MTFKQIFVTLVVLGSIFMFSQGAFANEVESNSDGTIIGETNVLNPDSNTEISEVLTFDELVNEISINEGITKSEAANQIKASFAPNQSKFGSSLSASSLDAVVTAATYRTISAQFTVNSFYKPSLRFYVQTSEGGGYWGIVKILNVGMNRDYYGYSKQYSGTVYSNLETAARIFWIVNGDFYDYGTTTSNGGVDIGIKQFATVKFSVSKANNHYAYVYKEGRVITQ
ncbi:hypothetical protein [Ferdinandcohnia sp. SAFN-114]|uniref:hypothetical protein n=1 Tax=Ferdinandcohnia sp. SAFN-114 TaxID=3387275 RepID=UPI003F7E0B38